MQKEAARETLELVGNGKRKTKGEVLRKVGYKPSVVKNPDIVFDSKGFKEELENFGLTEDLIKTSLVSDIKAKPKKRFFELSLGAEILGLKKQGSNGGNTNIQVNILNYAGNNTPTLVPSKDISTPGA